NAAPTTPVATVAVVRNLRRLVSTSSSVVMTPLSAIKCGSPALLPKLPVDRHQVWLSRFAAEATRCQHAPGAHFVFCARDCSFRPAGGGALYTNENALPVPGACLTDMHLLRPPPTGIFRRSFRLHRLGYARETIAKICSMGGALATVHISQAGSCLPMSESLSESRATQWQ